LLAKKALLKTFMQADKKKLKIFIYPKEENKVIIFGRLK